MSPFSARTLEIVEANTAKSKTMAVARDTKEIEVAAEAEVGAEAEVEAEAEAEVVVEVEVETGADLAVQTTEAISMTGKIGNDHVLRIAAMIMTGMNAM